MTAPIEQTPVQLTRLEGKIDLIAERVSNQAVASATAVEALQRSVDEIKRDMTKVREEGRHDISVVRVDLERQVQELAADLVGHEQLKNPHPQLEDWLRRDTRTVAAEVGKVRDEINGVKGAWRVLNVAAMAAVGVVASLITHALGG